ncbi:MAG: YqgE/AlgH family protein [Gammaproteobacteria bacterium]|nr:YqgE/AlgH family protein [Gammaproteobacteria bacterium]
MSESIDLKHHLLLAMPLLDDPWFKNSVCYICEHNDQGAMGLVINKPMGIHLGDILGELDIEASHEKDRSIMQGGPVSPEQGFVLYHGDDQDVQNMVVNAPVRLTTSKDILSNMAQGTGPDDAIICLGYAGWEAGQLEAEIANNSWLTVPADEELLFHTSSDQMAAKAASKLGIDLNLMSSQSGHA